MTPTITHKPVLALLAVFGAVAVSLALPATPALPFGSDLARAATYNVVACNDAGGPNHSWDQWWNSGVSTITSGQGCPNGGYDGNTNKGVFARYIANSTDPGGAAGGWAFNAPAGNNIASITLSDWFTRSNTNGPYAFLASNYGLLEGCFNGSTICGAVYGQHTLPVNGATQIRTEVGCASTSCLDSSGVGTSGIFEIYGATVTVNDNTAPSVSPSGAMWTNAWQRGVRSMTIGGGDGADGIQRTDLTIDGTTVASQPHGCDFSYVTPCPTNVGDGVSYDTRQLSDGPHTLRAISYDAGWLSASASTTINVDNHAPSKPTNPALQGATGWRSTNGFSVSWSDPAQDSASPIAAVHYSLCSASNTSNCPVTDQRVAGSGISSLSSISVPSAGDWVIRTWLEDAAGNVDPTATSDPIYLMYDPTPPGMAAPQHDNGWFNAANIKNHIEPIALDPLAASDPPVSGIAGYAVSVDGTTPGTTVDVSAGAGGMASYSIADLPEGRNVIKARAISGAGVPSSQVGSTEIDVDKTPPTAAVGGAPDPERWQNHGVTITVSASDQPDLSGMAASPDSDVHHGAYLSSRVDGGQAQLVPGDTAQVPVTDDGDHTVTYQAYDFAGNPSTEKSIKVKVDTTAPSPVVFEAPIPGDPRRLIVAAADKTSGLGSGVIEVRKQGTTAWTGLPTDRLSDSEYTTYLDDTQLDPSAKYEFRARVDDLAGNEAVGSTYADGAAVVLPGQLRSATHVAVGFGTSPHKCKAAAKHKRSKRRGRRRPASPKRCTTGRPHAKKHPSKAKRAQLAVQEAVFAAKRAGHHKKVKHHHHTASVPVVPGQRLVPFGKSAVVTGTLTTVEGAPVADQTIAVYATLRTPGSQAQLVGHVSSDSRGRFRYVAPAGASRTLDFRFEGTDTLYPSDQPVKLLVRASTTLRPSKRSVVNGQTVRFAGTLRGRPLPAAGKLIDLQVYYRRKWRTFATPRTNASGAWRFTYRFQATAGVVTYRFRAAVKRETAYPYELGYSRLVKVRVRG
jgi:hypothetical protein